MPTEQILKNLQTKIRVKNDLLRCLLSEFFATLLFVLIVNGSVASVITTGLDPVEHHFWISWAVGMGAGLAIWTGYGVSGGHVNPSVTIGLASTGKFPWRRVPIYFLTQFLAAMVACVICFLCYYDAINAFDGGERQAVGHENATCGIFTSFPGPHLSIGVGFFEQIVNTGILLALILMVADSRNAGPPFNVSPFYYGFTVLVVLLSYGVNAGAPLNPARDLAGRVMCAIAGYGPDVWVPYGKHWWWIGTFGPLVGAVTGSLLYYIMIEIHHPPEEDSEKDNHNESAAEMVESHDKVNTETGI